MTKAEAVINEELKKLLPPEGLNRFAVIVISYGDEGGESRVAQGMAMRDTSFDSVYDMVKMVRRLREHANELDDVVHCRKPFPMWGRQNG